MMIAQLNSGQPNANISLNQALPATNVYSSGDQMQLKTEPMS